MAEPFLGEIIMFGGNFAPRGWAFCDGQLLAINSYTALFSILGTMYGGDGRTTFGLPDLRGRVPMHKGNGPGLTPRNLGQKSGSENVHLTVGQLPAHNHVLANNAIEDDANQTDPGGNALAGSQIYRPGTPDAKTAPNATNNTGGNQAVPILQPYLCITFIIALQGIYPSRN
jgi:microcystin-dependent protein